MKDDRIYIEHILLSIERIESYNWKRSSILLTRQFNAGCGYPAAGNNWRSNQKDIRGVQKQKSSGSMV